MIVHAGLVAKRHGGGWFGVLVQGPSGSGKSDLALRALSAGFRLVADDRVRLMAAKGRLFGRAPAPLADLLELRGVGVVRTGSLRVAEVRLLACCTGSSATERLPDPAQTSILGVRIPLVSIRALESSAPAKLCRAIDALGSATQQDYDADFP